MLMSFLGKAQLSMVLGPVRIALTGLLVYFWAVWYSHRVIGMFFLLMSE